jgi:VWFA-related protein
MPEKSAPLRVAFAAAIFAGLTSPGLNGQARRQQPPPQFRTSTTLVPVDVRVLDRNGKPITDLTAADFTIFEDRVPQTISHFARQAFVAMEPEPGRVRLVRNTRSADLEPSTRRVFLLLLGRGRLQPPSKGVDAALTFVRDLVLPQDLVAVFAWNRATEFTTDHDRVAALLERFKKRHERIEALMRQRFSGLAAVYGSSRMPEGIQREIDAVFDGFETRHLAEAPVVDADRIADDNRRIRQLLEGTSELDTMGAEAAKLIDVSFDEFVDSAVETNQNLANLYTAIEYLRHIGGEKHLLFVTENMLSLRRQEDGDSLASIAADARVAIHPIHTGGLPAAAAGAITRGVMRHNSGGPVGLAARDQRAIADLTGGRSSAFRWADEAVRRIAEITSFSYVLGYYPTNQDWDGSQRRIEVRVNRPGATVMYRRSYFATHDLPALDLRGFATYRRIMSAGGYDRAVPDIGLEVAATYHDVDGVRSVDVTMTVAAERLALVEDEAGLRIGHIKIATFAGDMHENVVGDSWEDMNFRLRPDTYARLLAEGIPHRVTIPVLRQASYVKVVVYDYAADLLGSVIVKVR